MLINFTLAAIAATLNGSMPAPAPWQCDSPAQAYEILSEQYDLTQKIDTVEELVRPRTKHHKAVYRSVTEDFSWKDRKAAERVGQTVWQFAIENIWWPFAHNLCRLIETAEVEGHEIGITRGFADVYRQHIASGKKASDGGSYHGSRPELGPKHGEAVDVVGLGQDRAEALRNNERVWAYIDRYGPSEFDVGRPYGDRDAPHVGPADGREYLAHHDHEISLPVARDHHHEHKRTRLAHHHHSLKHLASV